MLWASKQTIITVIIIINDSKYFVINKLEHLLDLAPNLYIIFSIRKILLFAPYGTFARSGRFFRAIVFALFWVFFSLALLLRIDSCIGAFLVVCRVQIISFTKSSTITLRHPRFAFKYSTDSRQGTHAHLMFVNLPTPDLASFNCLHYRS